MQASQHLLICPKYNMMYHFPCSFNSEVNAYIFIDIVIQKLNYLYLSLNV